VSHRETPRESCRRYYSGGDSSILDLVSYLRNYFDWLLATEMDELCLEF
jgi:hypothetical protein